MTAVDRDRRRSAALEHLLRVVAQAAHAADNSAAALEIALHEICEFAGWPVRHALQRERTNGRAWRSAQLWHLRAGADLDPFVRTTESHDFAQDLGLLAHAVAERSPAWIVDIATETEMSRRNSASDCGLVSALVIPVHVDAEVEAILEFYSFEPMEPDGELLDAVGQIGVQLGVVLKEKQLRAALRASEERFKALVVNSRDVIALVDRQGRLDYVSPSIDSILGYAPEELRGMDVLELVHPQDLDSAQQVLGGVQEQPGASLEADIRARHKNGHWRWLAATATNQLDQPHVGAIVINARDITDRVEADRRLQETAHELERSNEELERFAYVASHDLQEPLRMVSGYMQLLSSRYRDALDEDAQEFIDFAVDGATRMQRLINDMLMFSRVGTRGQELEPTDLNLVVERVRKDLETMLAETSAAVEIDDRLPRVQADPSQVAQLFQNLISNAVKFKKPGEQPQVRIAAERSGAMVRLSVSDNGIGIDSKYKDRIFVIFQRLHTREEYDGTGIGLALCKKIVERHGGQIWFESEVGEGTTFHFTLRPAQPGG